MKQRKLTASSRGGGKEERLYWGSHELRCHREVELLRRRIMPIGEKAPPSIMGGPPLGTASSCFRWPMATTAHKDGERNPVLRGRRGRRGLGGRGRTVGARQRGAEVLLPHRKSRVLTDTRLPCVLRESRVGSFKPRDS